MVGTSFAASGFHSVRWVKKYAIPFAMLVQLLYTYEALAEP
jgi:hypothetical protein